MLRTNNPEAVNFTAPKPEDLESYFGETYVSQELRVQDRGERRSPSLN